MKARTKTLLTALVTSTAIIAGSADAATTYVWTGAGAPNENVNNAANWLVNGVVPAAAPSDNGGQPATPGIDDVLLFDSLSATWVAPPRVARKLFSNTPDRPWGSIVVNNGTIDFRGDGNSFRNQSWSGTNTVVVGDGDANAAVLNLFLYELNAGTSTIGGSPSPNDTKTYVVNSDGTLVNGQLGSSGNSTDLTWSNNATLDTVMRLLGGTSIIDVAIDEASILDDAGDYVSFEALGSTFTFGKGAEEGLFDEASDVTGAFGDSFRLGGGLNTGNAALALTDDGTSWTVTAVVPEPSSLALLGLGGLLLARRRRA